MDLHDYFQKPCKYYNPLKMGNVYALLCFTVAWYGYISHIIFFWILDYWNKSMLVDKDFPTRLPIGCRPAVGKSEAMFNDAC